jgi:hypothetical protein
MKTIRTPSYEADDGELFDTAEDCRAYERSKRFAVLAKLTAPAIEALPLTADAWGKANSSVRETALTIEELGTVIAKARREAGDVKRVVGERAAPAKAARAKSGVRKAKAATPAKAAKVNGATEKRGRKPKNGNGAAVEEPASPNLFSD